MVVSEAVARVREIIVAEKEKRLRMAVEKRISVKAMTVARALGAVFYKTHGYYHVFPPIKDLRDIYEQRRTADLLIIYDDYGMNIDVYSNGRKVYDVSLGYIELYVPGEWERKLEELYAEAKKREEERREREELKKLLEEAEKWQITIEAGA